MKLSSDHLNPFQAFAERGLANQNEERPGPAIENNLSRAVFSALANAENPNVLAMFVEELAKNAPEPLRNNIRNLARELRNTEPSKVEVGLQGWPVEAVMARKGDNVFLFGISFQTISGDWTHDKRKAPSESQTPQADAWIYVPGKMLLVFEFKNDEHPLDATQVSEYIHELKLVPEKSGTPRAERSSTLASKAEAQAVQKACKDKDLVIDADWSAAIAALKLIQEDRSIGCVERWLTEKAREYIESHVRPPYRGIQTILDWLKDANNQPRRAYLETLVTKLGEELMKAANGLSGAITFGEMGRGARAARYVKLKQNGAPLEFKWLCGGKASLVLWFHFNEDETEQIGLEYYLQAPGAQPYQGKKTDDAWNQGSADHLKRAKEFEDQMRIWCDKARPDTLLDVSTLRFNGKSPIWRGCVEDMDGPNLRHATPQDAMKFIQDHKAEVWRFPRVDPGGKCNTVEEAQPLVRKPALGLIEPFATKDLAKCSEDGQALQEFLQKAVESIKAKASPK